MASSLALRRLVSSNLVSGSLRFIRPANAVPSASRLFNTNAVRQFEEDDERGLDVDRRSGHPLSRGGNDFFSDIFEPFFPSRSLNQVLNMMNNPFFSAPRDMTSGLRRSWDVRETEDALNLRIDMPGLGKEDVQVTVEHNTLIIRGEGKNESEDAVEGGRKFSSRIDLPEKIYRTDEIKAEMKNGVLKVVVPKMKEDERTDVLHVKVE